MNLPTKGTRGRAVVDYLFKVGESTVEQIRVALEPNIKRALVNKAIADLQDRSCIEHVSGHEGRLRSDDVAKLTAEARFAMEDDYGYEEEKRSSGPLVQPRQVNVLTAPPLSKSLYINTKGTRPDSDWSQYASLHAPMSKPV